MGVYYAHLVLDLSVDVESLYQIARVLWDCSFWLHFKQSCGKSHLNIIGISLLKQIGRSKVFTSLRPEIDVLYSISTPDFALINITFNVSDTYPEYIKYKQLSGNPGVATIPASK